jgi:hypothetical protein
LGTFGTGLPPGLTGLAGYSLRDPATGRRTSLIGWETTTPPEEWQPHPTYFQHLAAMGEPATFIGQRRFHGSPMTVACLRGARFVPAGDPSDRVAAAVEACARGGVVYLYWGELDKAGHAQGWQSRRWVEGLEELDRAMADLRAGLPATVALWVTADHGMVDTDPNSAIDVAAHPALTEGVTTVAGEARAVHVYGEGPGEIAERWRGTLGDGAWVMTKTQAVGLGLFGPRVADRVLPMLGDVIVAVNGLRAIVDSRTATPASLEMVGQHGSLTAAEMDVPLIDVPS